MTDITPQGNHSPTGGEAPVVTTTPETPVTPEKVVAPTWREDWRQELAGEDAKELKRVERFNSPKDIYKAYRSMEQKLSSGEYKTALPTDATPEQVTEWRNANGIPEKPEQYYEKLADGLVIGEADKPIVDKFVKAMHDNNADPKIVNAALDVYYSNLQEQQAALAEGDKQFAVESEESLRAEWGAEYRGNKNMISNFLDTAPDGLKDRLLGGSLADGRLIKDDPVAQRWLAGMARELNPMATIVPATGAGSIQSLETEQAAIAAKMGTKAYTDADRSRFTEIVGILEKANKHR